jgi:hypothetical protein
MNGTSVEMRLRRSLLKRVALLVTGMAALPLIQTLARAAEKLQKAAVNYQDKPKNGKDCDDCMQFIAGATPKAIGTCKVVDGAISPHGFCSAFTPKPGNRS